MKLIALTQGQSAMVDDADFDWLNQFSWHAHRNDNHFTASFYARRCVRDPDGRKGVEGMHTLIVRPDPGFVCDHIDGNGLNNQRSNLRQCTRRQNRINHRKQTTATSRFIGVYRTGNRWVAKVDGKHVGTFRTEEEALAARTAAAKAIHGDFARVESL